MINSPMGHIAVGVNGKTRFNLLDSTAGNDARAIIRRTKRRVRTLKKAIFAIREEEQLALDDQREADYDNFNDLEMEDFDDDEDV